MCCCILTLSGAVLHRPELLSSLCTPPFLKVADSTLSVRESNALSFTGFLLSARCAHQGELLELEVAGKYAVVGGSSGRVKTEFLMTPWRYACVHYLTLQESLCIDQSIAGHLKCTSTVHLSSYGMNEITVFCLRNRVGDGYGTSSLPFIQRGPGTEGPRELNIPGTYCTLYRFFRIECPL